MAISYIEFFKNFNFFDKLKLYLIHKFYSRYHPIDIFTYEESSKRNVINRYQSIQENLRGSNCLDIGCQSGYFSLKISSQGYWVTGLDADEIILEKANLLRKKHSIQNVAFANFSLNTDNVNSLQVFDNILYLSIHHHMIKVYGFEKATHILKVLCKKTKYNLFFDFPYPEAYEGNELFSEIPNMKANPDKWIENYLLDAGFTKVISLNKFAHNMKPEEKRNLFLAIK